MNPRLPVRDAFCQPRRSPVPDKDAFRQVGISVPPYYKWKSMYGRLDAFDLRR